MELFVIILLLFLIVLLPIKEGFQHRPTPEQKERMISEIKSNKDLFTSGDYYGVRRMMPWVDAVAYEDIRNVIKGGTLDGIERVFP
jgi:hypothetical protein